MHTQDGYAYTIPDEKCSKGWPVRWRQLAAGELVASGCLTPSLAIEFCGYNYHYRRHHHRCYHKLTALLSDVYYYQYIQELASTSVSSTTNISMPLAPTFSSSPFHLFHLPQHPSRPHRRGCAFREFMGLLNGLSPLFPENYSRDRRASAFARKTRKDVGTTFSMGFALDEPELLF